MSMFKLIYFPVRGRAEYIRTLILDQGGQYEEEDCLKQWEKVKETMAFGQTPCLIDGDFRMVQSNAILRYLGRKYRLYVRSTANVIYGREKLRKKEKSEIYGSDDKEAFNIDMVNDGAEDLRAKYVRMVYQNYENGKGPFIEELPNDLKYFENFMESKKYIIGDTVCWADYNLGDLMDILLTLAPGCLDKFPNLKAYHTRMLARPGVQKRRETDNFKNMTINGNGKQ